MDLLQIKQLGKENKIEIEIETVCDLTFAYFRPYGNFTGKWMYNNTEIQEALSNILAFKERLITEYNKAIEDAISLLEYEGYKVEKEVEEE